MGATSWFYGIGLFFALLLFLWLLNLGGLISLLLFALPYFLVLSLLIFCFVKVFVKKYGETERAIIFRFGKFHRVAGPGWSIVLPFIEREFKRFDIRIRPEMLSNISVVTKDDIPLSIDATIFYGIADPKKASLQVTVLEDTLKNYFVGAIRNGIGNFSMRDVFSRIENIGMKLQTNVAYALQQWGINVSTIQITRVKLPESVLAALVKPVTAEQEALAARFQAEARRVLVEVLGDAAERLNPNALTYLYLKALEKIGTSEASKIVLPANLPSILNSLAAGVGLAAGLEGVKESEVVDKIVKKLTSR